MLLAEVLTELQNLTNSKISQTELGKALGITRSAISLRIKNKSEVSYAELKKIENYFNVSLTKFKQTNHALINSNNKEAIKNTVRYVKDSLTRYKGKSISYDYLAKILGCSKQNLWQNPERILTDEQIKLIETSEKVSLTEVNLVENTNVSMKYFVDVLGSCGSGAFEQSQNFEIINVPVQLIGNFSPKKDYSVINAYGDSMSPTIINKDKLIIEHLFNNNIIDNKIYVFAYENHIYIKRLVKNIDEIIIISDNEDKSIYETKKIRTYEMNDLFIIGQVVGIFRDLRG